MGVNMKITYLNHSGFLLEYGKSAFLFDYYKGKIPELTDKKNIFVFVSHTHWDHYNQEIFLLQKMYHNVTYILSNDIHLKDDFFPIYQIVEENVVRVKSAESYCLQDSEGNDLKIMTLASTDEGVAFYLEYMDKFIYHAGDLNLWVWKEETKAYNQKMMQDYKQQIEVLKYKTIDVAFLPLDPRQEEEYAGGIMELLKIANIDTIFPMHFWGKQEVIDKFILEYSGKIGTTKIIKIEKDGQEYEI